MKDRERVPLTFAIITILTLSIMLQAFKVQVLAQPNAHLTGVVQDHGVDTDADGLFNHLLIDVQVQVSVNGTYEVSISSLRPSYYVYLYFSSRNQTYLEAGLRSVTLAVDGIAIYGSRLNLSYIHSLSLSYHVGNMYFSEMLPDVPLPAVYGYDSYDPGAVLTGVVYDQGVDTNANGLFDYLQIGVELNVTDAAYYQVSVSELYSMLYPNYTYIDVRNSTEEFLSAGIQVLNVWLQGPKIYSSRATNISEVVSISLYYMIKDPGYYGQFDLGSADRILLSRAYAYTEFESLAYFTGTVFDRGVDRDGDSKFDFLEISAEINVTKAGTYLVDSISLRDDAFGYLYMSETNSTYLDTGLNVLSVMVYGQMIYAQGFNPRYLETMTLTGLDFRMQLDRLSHVALPTPYQYSEFESHALFTGTVSDRGVDADGNGFYDYLEVGIGINVTEQGTYLISCRELLGQTYNSTGYLTEYQAARKDLDVGPHTVYLNFSGPHIASSHFNPTDVGYTELWEPAPNVRLDYMSSKPLSAEYNYTSFDHPLRHTQVDFVVYPDGAVDVSGEFNYTHMYPSNTGPLANANLTISTNGDTTTGAAKGTFEVPENVWPFNSTVIYGLSRMDNGYLNASLDAVVFMPPAGRTMYPIDSSGFNLHSAYSNGLLNVDLTGNTTLPSYIKSEIPFNVSDFIVLADYAGNEINGNITFRAVSGLEDLAGLGEVMAYFSGNKTDIYLTGNATILYGTYHGLVMNATTMEELLSRANSTLPGQGPDSLYDVTGGLLECTRLNTTRTALISNSTEYGSLIDYVAAVHGNFTDYLAKFLAQLMYPSSPDLQNQTYPIMYAGLESAMSSVKSGSLQFIYYHTTGMGSLDLHLTSDVKALWSKALELVPPAAPPEAQSAVTAYARIANATAYAIDDFSLDASYSSSTQKLQLTASILMNTSQLEKDVRSIMPDAYPAELQDIVRAFLNTTYCSLESSRCTIDYTNGTAVFDMTSSLRGDFKAQINHIKHFYVNLYNTTLPPSMTSPLTSLNETEIDISNFELTCKLERQKAYVAFNGLRLHPPKDYYDHIRFKLERFFNVTGQLPWSPSEYGEVKIVVTGATNGTHIVLLHAPGTMPVPDVVSLNFTAMSWQNTSTVNMKSLNFALAYLGKASHAGSTYYVPVLTNSTVSSFDFNQGSKMVSFYLTGSNDTKGFCNVTLPKSLLYASSTEWIIRIGDRQLLPGEYVVTENAEYTFLSLNYSHSSHMIQIVGTWVVPEYPPSLLPPVMLALCLIAAIIAVSQRRRLKMLKTSVKTTLAALSARARLS